MTRNAHAAVVEVGPGTIRRLCCGTGDEVDAETFDTYAAALDSVDDRVALIDGRPIAVAALWQDLLASLDCGGTDASEVMTVVHPSWWPDRRVGVVAGANQVFTQSRSRLLVGASSAELEATVVVEISQRLVVILGDGVVAVPRTGVPHGVAEQAARAVAGMWLGAASVVLVDAPRTVAGAAAVAASIAEAIREIHRVQPAVIIDDIRLLQPARPARSPSVQPCGGGPGPSGVRARAPMLPWLALSGGVLAAAVSAAATLGHRTVPPGHRDPTTFLVEGRVALTVPTNWSMRRVVAGPGSARVQLISPTDPEAALHVTQTPVRSETLDGTAERLKHAMDAEPGGVFVDFNPSAVSAGRPAVTYREVRAGHQVRWVVFVDGPVRISIGCQSRPGGEDALRDVCDQAVGSAHALG